MKLLTPAIGFLFFAACAHKPPQDQVTCMFPDKVADREAIFNSIPAGCGPKTRYMQTMASVDQGQDFIVISFLKNSPVDQLPGQVGIYRKAESGELKLSYAAPLPVPPGGCLHRECGIEKFGIAQSPDGRGFQISPVMGGQFPARSTYQFHWSDDDFQLVLKIENINNSSSPELKEKFCSRAYRYAGGQRVDKTESREIIVPLKADEMKPRFLKKDHIVYKAPNHEQLCAEIAKSLDNSSVP
jgi:hypothetical protein